MKQPVLVARAIFPDVLARLREHFEVDYNEADEVWSPDELSSRLSGKVGVLATGSERIDAALLDAHPQLEAVCNMAVGYNNIDVEAAAGVASSSPTRPTC